MFESLRGQFLIAGRRLRDPNFFKTAVLIVEHGPGGAMGLVVNRPSSMTVAHALSEHFNLPETEDLVYVGGPVEPSSLFILHDSPEFAPSEGCIVPGLFLGSSAEVFESVIRLAAHGEIQLRFRIFSGCAGWAPHQLEGEIARGDWHLHPADAGMVFQEDSYQTYDLLLQKVYEAHRILPHMPHDPECN
jgi:putative transcriptional regulator